MAASLNPKAIDNPDQIKEIFKTFKAEKVHLPSGLKNPHISISRFPEEQIEVDEDVFAKEEPIVSNKVMAILLKYAIGAVRLHEELKKHKEFKSADGNLKRLLVDLVQLLGQFDGSNVKLKQPESGKCINAFTADKGIIEACNYGNSSFCQYNYHKAFRTNDYASKPVKLGRKLISSVNKSLLGDTELGFYKYNYRRLQRVEASFEKVWELFQHETLKVVALKPSLLIHPIRRWIEYRLGSRNLRKLLEGAAEDVAVKVDDIIPSTLTTDSLKALPSNLEQVITQVTDILKQNDVKTIFRRYVTITRDDYELVTENDLKLAANIVKHYGGDRKQLRSDLDIEPLSPRAFSFVFNSAVFGRTLGWMANRLVTFLLSKNSLKLDRDDKTLPVYKDLETFFLTSFDLYIEALRHFQAHKQAHFALLSSFGSVSLPEEAYIIRKTLINSLEINQHVTIMGGFFDIQFPVEIALVKENNKKKDYRVRLFAASLSGSRNPLVRFIKLDEQGGKVVEENRYLTYFEFFTDNLEEYRYFLYPGNHEDHEHKIYPSSAATNYFDPDLKNFSLLPRDDKFGVFNYIRVKLGLIENARAMVNLVSSLEPEVIELFNKNAVKEKDSVKKTLKLAQKYYDVKETWQAVIVIILHLVKQDLKSLDNKEQIYKQLADESKSQLVKDYFSKK